MFMSVSGVSTVSYTALSVSSMMLGKDSVCSPDDRRHDGSVSSLVSASDAGAPEAGNIRPLGGMQRRRATES